MFSFCFMKIFNCIAWSDSYKRLCTLEIWDSQVMQRAHLTWYEKCFSLVLPWTRATFQKASKWCRKFSHPNSICCWNVLYGKTEKFMWQICYTSDFLPSGFSIMWQSTPTYFQSLWVCGILSTIKQPNVRPFSTR